MLFDKQVNVQKEGLNKYFWSSRKLPQAHKKVCDENKNNDMHKSVFDGRKQVLCKAHTKNW